MDKGKGGGNRNEIQKGKVKESNVELALIDHCLAVRQLFCHYLFVLIHTILPGFPLTPDTP